MKTLSTIVAVLAALCLALGFGGCCSKTKETETVVVPAQSTNPTLGKELEDLEAAYKKGAITRDEYDTAKKKLIEQGGGK